jgi:serine/threonine-protein kinase RsbW
MEAHRMVHVAGSREGIRRAADDLGRFSAAHDLPPGAVWPFQIALDEMLSNIVDHGYAKPETGREIEVEFRLEHGVLELTIVDDAAAFDPLAVEEPDTSRPAEARPIGGLGIFLVRKLMDAVEYERRDGRNRLVCRKRVEV